jgi:Mn-dependent DtxR family transcriptional regulator
METMISEGHIDYDHSKGIATLTEAGRAYARP